MNNYTIIGIVLTVIIVLGVAVIVGPGSSSTSITSDSYSTSTQVQTLVANQEKEKNIMTTTERPVVVLHTSYGQITLELFADKTPVTVKNFLTLSKSGFYDDTLFHRVIPGFMIQGGDPLTKSDPKNWGIHGTGGPNYRFADEINSDNHNNAGTISMANAGPNTNGSQFFINVADNSFLNTKHTVFGKVIAGMDVVNKIVVAKTNENDHPLEDVKIEKIEVK